MNVAQDGFDVVLRLPVKVLRHAARISEVDPHVQRIRLVAAGARPGNWHSAPGDILAEAGQFQQRNRNVRSTADVVNATVPGIWAFNLTDEQFEQVLDVQQVSHLLACAAEAGVLQGAIKMMAGHPQCHDPLVNLAHLPGAANNPATIDQCGQAASVVVLLN